LESESGSLEQANCLAALDLLIQDMELNWPFLISLTSRKFLLFGGKVGNQTNQDPHAFGARQTSIHILPELVNPCIPRLRGKQKEIGPSVDSLFLTLHGLAGHCYRVPYICIFNFAFT
jgi:nuclear pore complex protein Nup205